MIYLIVETVRYYSRDEQKPVGYENTREEAEARVKYANEHAVVCPAGDGLIQSVSYRVVELGQNLTPSLMVDMK